MLPNNDTDLIPNSKVQKWAEDCVARLRQFVGAQPESELALRFSKALATVQEVEVSALDGCAFEIIDKKFVLSSGPLQNVFNTVFEQINEDDLDLDPEEIPKLCNLLVAIFLLHELRHIDQRVDRYEDIQTLKSLGFATLVAQFDLLADRDAVIAFSILYADDLEVSRSEAFEIGLAFSPSYFFKAFDFDPKTKPHKTLRAVCIILMLARLYVAKEHQNKPKVAIDAALSFYGLEALDGETEADFVIVAEQPSRQVYQIADHEWRTALGSIITSVEQNKYGLALAQAMEIVTLKEFLD